MMNACASLACIARTKHHFIICNSRPPQVITFLLLLLLLVICNYMAPKPIQIINVGFVSSARSKIISNGTKYKQFSWAYSFVSVNKLDIEYFLFSLFNCSFLVGSDRWASRGITHFQRQCMWRNPYTMKMDNIVECTAFMRPLSTSIRCISILNGICISLSGNEKIKFNVKWW